MCRLQAGSGDETVLAVATGGAACAAAVHWLLLSPAFRDGGPGSGAEKSPDAVDERVRGQTAAGASLRAASPSALSRLSSGMVTERFNHFCRFRGT